MDKMAHIADWLNRQHVLAYCVSDGVSLWCANAFYIFDRDTMTFYLLTSTETRHGTMAGTRTEVAGTISDQQQTLIRIRGLQFHGELRLLEGDEGKRARRRYNQHFPAARVMPSAVWAIDIDEMKFTDNTLGFGKKLAWLREDLS